jgi:hypothetical protein
MEMNLEEEVVSQATSINSAMDAILAVRALALRCGYQEGSEFLACLDALPKQHQ